MSSAEVDAFVHGLDEEWKRRDCAAMVHIIRTLDVPLTESIKWGNPFFAGNKAVPRGLLEASDTARMRTMRLTGAAPLDAEGFGDLLRAAIALDGPRA